MTISFGMSCGAAVGASIGALAGCFPFKAEDKIRVGAIGAGISGAVGGSIGGALALASTIGPGAVGTVLGGVASLPVSVLCFFATAFSTKTGVSSRAKAKIACIVPLGCAIGAGMAIIMEAGMRAMQYQCPK